MSRRVQESTARPLMMDTPYNRIKTNNRMKTEKLNDP